jgi:hypothetical protein
MQPTKFEASKQLEAPRVSSFGMDVAVTQRGGSVEKEPALPRMDLPRRLICTRILDQYQT